CRAKRRSRSRSCWLFQSFLILHYRRFTNKSEFGANAFLVQRLGSEEIKIERLAMSEVERYSCPAYRTKFSRGAGARFGQIFLRATGRTSSRGSRRCVMNYPARPNRAVTSV